LRLTAFRPQDDYPHSMPRALGHAVTANGRNYFAYAWIGPKAPPRARAALAQIASSLSFPRLRTGTLTGNGNGFQVLQPLKHYPVGSFTRVRASGQSFYLVHAPGGLYAVGWRWLSLSGGYRSACNLELDRSRKEFFCTNLKARWDRVGRPLVLPAGALRGLDIADAKPSWDGHVLLRTGIARFVDKTLARKLWPRS
jgi:hypothetical protein